MNELIKVYEKDGSKYTDARGLFTFLEVSTNFTTWCKRMFDYGFEEGFDFFPFLEESQGGRPSTNYELTIDCAKEISMLQRTPRGKSARLYFIECEKKAEAARELLTAYREVQKPKSTLEILQATINQMVEHESRLDNLDDRVLLIESKTETKNTDYYTLSGYYKIKSMRFDLSRQEAISRGKALTAESKRLGYPIQTEYDAKYGSINCYHIDILKVILKF